MAPATVSKKAPRKASKPAEDSVAFGPIAERFRRAGDLDRAISLCREGLQKYPNQISARVTLGWALLEQGGFEDARAELELVLRRAPDNLAAIRGLAELHDRAEQTMNLPMDGPGQWPPPPDAVDVDDEVPVPHVSISAAAKTKAKKSKADPAAEPVWLPVQRVEETAEGPVPAAIIAPAELGLAVWSPVAEPEATTPAHTSASGMSSVRELDPDAGVVTFDGPAAPASSPPVETLVAGPVEPPVVVHDPPAAAHLDRDEVNIAALIAEVESLEADAEVGAEEAPTLVLDAGMDLDVLTEVGLAEPLQSQPVVAEPGPTSDVLVGEELVAGSDLDELVAIAEEPSFVLTPPSALIATEEMGEAAEYADAPIELDAETAPTFDFDAPAVLVAIAEAPSEAPVAPLPFIVPVPELSKPVPVPPAQVLALEQFLHQVQRRRRQIVAESVA
jgi:hypothetical protein